MKIDPGASEAFAGYLHGMEEFEHIRNLFRPIQPTVAAADGPVSYREVFPSGRLSAFVYCFWQLRSARTLSAPFTYRVVSDGCIDLFADLDRADDCDIMGFCRKFIQFPLGTSFHYVGVRFLPAAFPLLFGIDAGRLSDRSQPLRGVIPDLAQWVSSSLHSKLPLEQISQLFSLEIERMLKNRPITPDTRFFAALCCILRSGGNLKVETDLNTGLSPRQLRRHCRHFLGTSPKVFAAVVRFQRVLSLAGTASDESAINLYQDAGFFDQAHFIRSFQRFYGVSPGVALG